MPKADNKLNKLNQNKKVISKRVKWPDNKICPICGETYKGYPAISRKDNKTKICPDCGTAEALDAYLNFHYTGDKENDLKYCIFEKKLCRFAIKTGYSFECKAPSDEALKLICNSSKEE